MLFESFHPKTSIRICPAPGTPKRHRVRKGALALALAVAAAAPVVMPSPCRAAAAMTEIDQAMLLLAAQAQTASDPDLLKQGIEQFNKGQYEEAQATLQQVKADGLPQGDRDRLADAIRKVEGALAERKAARAEFELGEQAMAEKRYAEATRHYRAATENKFADQATLDKARSQIAVAQAAGGGGAAAATSNQDLRGLYRDAVADYKARRYDQAKAKFEQLQAAGYRGGLFDRKPHEFLRDINRRQGAAEQPAVTQSETTTTTTPPRTAEQTTTTTPPPPVVDTTPTTTTPPTTTVPPVDTTTTQTEVVVEPAEPTTPTTETPARSRYSPKQAYEAGRAAYRRGDYAAARGFMEEARRGGYKPGLFGGDSPDRYIRNIEARERQAAERSTVVAASTQAPPANGGRTTIVEETTVRTEQPETTNAAEEALRDTATRERLVSDQRRAEAAGLVREAQALQRDNRLAEAYALYAQAAELDPTNQQAIAGRNETQVVAAGVADRPLIESQIQRNKIRKEIIDYRLRQAIADANAATARRDFVAARESIEAAVVARESDPALFTPQELNAFNSMIADARVRLERAEQVTTTREEVDAREQARIDALRRAEEEDRERRGTVAALVRQARQMTYDRNYEQALGVINQILAIDPTNEYAVGVRQLVVDYAKLAEQRRLRERRDAEFVNQLNRAEEAKIPYMDILNFPTNWPDISELRDRAVLEERQGGAIDAQVQAVLDKRLPEIRFDNVALAEVVEFLRDISGANIFVNWRTLEAAGVERNAAVTARLRDVRFSKALETILRDVGGGAVPLGYTVDEGVITISTAEDLNSNTDIQVYDIRDLLVIAPEFVEPPDFDLSQYTDQGGGGGRGGGGGGRGGGGGGGRGGGGGGGGGGGLFQNVNQSGQTDTRSNAERVQELVDEISTLVRETVDRDSWVDNGGRFGSLRFLSGQLIVTQTPENHRQIISLLDKLRETRAIQVSIETRFLTVQRNFLEDIGVDIDFFFNIQDPNRFSPISVNQNNAFPTAPSSSVPGSIGAGAQPSMVVQGSFLDEYQVNFLIRATQASENSTILTAPRVTVFNGQQAFVVVAQQQAYVSDLEAVTGEGVGLFNPVIGTVASGVRLVVQPTVSADRKYVTLSLQPQVAQLIDLVDFPVFGLAQDPNVIGGGDTNVFEAAVQLPIVQLTAVNTIVSVPDGGTLLLGGQTLAAEIEREQGVPILSKIPIIKRLFTNKSIAKDEQVLLILVKPSIIIQREVEQQQFPLLNTRTTGG